MKHTQKTKITLDTYKDKRRRIYRVLRRCGNPPTSAAELTDLFLDKYLEHVIVVDACEL
jgi:hypothetical protein